MQQLKILENVQTIKEKTTKNQNFDQLDFGKDEINNDQIKFLSHLQNAKNKNNNL
jgi:hypothetical protein